MPEITLPKIDVNKAAAEFNKAVKEGAYVAVGLGVLGFQRAQAQRVEWTKQLESQWEDLGKLALKLNSQLNSQAGEYAQSARSQAETARTQWAEQLIELVTRLDELVVPARVQLARALWRELPNLPGLGQQFTDADHALDDQLEALRSRLAEIAKVVDDRVQPARQRLDGQVDRVEERLPAAARSVVQSWRALLGTPEQIWRNSVGLN